jgi:sulfatase maturation enzyme AslB (radical SAM superfamily)
MQEYVFCSKLLLIMPRELKSWNDGRAKNVTFIVTKDCQLACKYCYLVGKNSKERMSFETAKAAIDYILNDRAVFNNSSVIWDFIGGEPFLEIDLIDRVCDYIKRKLFEYLEKSEHPDPPKRVGAGGAKAPQELKYVGFKLIFC